MTKRALKNAVIYFALATTEGGLLSCEDVLKASGFSEKTLKWWRDTKPDQNPTKNEWLCAFEKLLMLVYEKYENSGRLNFFVYDVMEFCSGIKRGYMNEKMIVKILERNNKKYWPQHTVYKKIEKLRGNNNG